VAVLLVPAATLLRVQEAIPPPAPEEPLVVLPEGADTLMVLLAVDQIRDKAILRAVVRRAGVRIIQNPAIMVMAEAIIKQGPRQNAGFFV
jgi:hypothetical protein